MINEKKVQIFHLFRAYLLTIRRDEALGWVFKKEKQIELLR
jgi:hypothetical protein